MGADVLSPEEVLDALFSKDLEFIVMPNVISYE